ncbi:MAG: sigma-70 family RNA polymerase sigma factor [Isosphaeraceae bacterium]|nr:sigma-70 family RNA polymerase sigma factor [Isosphaeraceae bacterium]
MSRNDGGTTCPALLRRVGDWTDLPAWREFVARYDPLLRRWCRDAGLDDDSVEEACQRIWIELASRMGSFRYDPGLTFRGWLRRFCRCRVIDLLRVRRRDAERARPLDDAAWLVVQPDEAADGDHSILLREAEQAQAAVRARVDPKTWTAFWRIAVEGWTVGEAAAAGGMSYASAFAARKRVGQKLREEGRRRLAALSGAVR